MEVNGDQITRFGHSLKALGLQQTSGSSARPPTPHVFQRLSPRSCPPRYETYPYPLRRAECRSSEIDDQSRILPDDVVTALTKCQDEVKNCLRAEHGREESGIPDNVNFQWCPGSQGYVAGHAQCGRRGGEGEPTSSQTAHVDQGRQGRVEPLIPIFLVSSSSSWLAPWNRQSTVRVYRRDLAPRHCQLAQTSRELELGIHSRRRPVLGMYHPAARNVSDLPVRAISIEWHCNGIRNRRRNTYANLLMLDQGEIRDAESLLKSRVGKREWTSRAVWTAAVRPSGDIYEEVS